MKIESTTNYDMFTFLEGNREPKRPHIDRLKKSMSVRYLMAPITVNEKYQIIDGQHRFISAKELGLNINYIVMSDYGVEDVQRLNTNMTNWTAKDYLDSYCGLGYKDYIDFKAFSDTYKMFPVSTALAIAGYGKSKQFKEGSFRMKKPSIANSLADFICEAGKYYNGYVKRSFTRALMSVDKLDCFDRAVFLHKLSINRSLMYDCSNGVQYTELIEKIYNKSSRKKVSLRSL